jgi:hypothetical protein
MEQPALEPVPAAQAEPQATPPPGARPVEHGGRRSNVSKGLEPTRFGDWEKDGRCIDF